MGKHPTQNLRLLAAKSLLNWFRNDAINYLSRTDFERDSDYTLYKHLTSSVIRHKLKYLYFIGKLTGKPLSKLDDEVVVCLMLGIAQLEAGSKIEPYAAINETVELISFLKKPFLKGFINANLRRYSREKEKLADSLEKQPVHIRTSHSQEMYEGWKKRFGKAAAEEICQANNELPVMQIAINPKYGSKKVIAALEKESFQIESGGGIGFQVSNPAGLFQSKEVKQGAILVQDSAFQRLNRFLVSIPKKSVLDVCAAPGGKLFHLEWEFPDHIDCMVACDISPNRIKRLKQNAELFNSRAILIVADGLFLPIKSKFDLIILDAPCSGTGTIRKHPEIKWSRSKNDVLSNQKLQLDLVERCSLLVKPGGHVFYITCSLEFEENQAVIERFLEKNSRAYELVPLVSDDLTVGQSTPEEYYQCLPSKHQMGCFAALLRNKTATK